MKQSGAENGAANTIPSLTASFDAESVRPLCAAEAARLSPTPADGAPEAIAAPAEHITETESERARDAAALAGRRPFLLGIISIPMTSHQHWLGCRHATTERERGFKSKTPKADRCSDASTRRTFCATLTHSETRFPRRNLASAPGARVSRRGFAPRATAFARSGALDRLSGAAADWRANLPSARGMFRAPRGVVVNIPTTPLTAPETRLILKHVIDINTAGGSLHAFL